MYDRIFGVFSDTLSTISNFAPQLRDDPSARMKMDTETSKDLFPPFIYLNITDVHRLKDSDFSNQSYLWKLGRYPFIHSFIFIQYIELSILKFILDHYGELMSFQMK